MNQLFPKSIGIYISIDNIIPYLHTPKKMFLSTQQNKLEKSLPLIFVIN